MSNKKYKSLALAVAMAVSLAGAQGTATAAEPDADAAATAAADATTAEGAAAEKTASGNDAAWLTGEGREQMAESAQEKPAKKRKMVVKTGEGNDASWLTGEGRTIEEVTPEEAAEIKAAAAEQSAAAEGAEEQPAEETYSEESAEETPAEEPVAETAPAEVEAAAVEPTVEKTPDQEADSEAVSNEEQYAEGTAEAEGEADMVAESAAGEEGQAAAEEAAVGQDGKSSSEYNKRAADFVKDRPEEKAIADSWTSLEGQTVVEVNFEGGTPSTRSTAQAAITMRAGDKFSGQRLEADRGAIFDTGYIYDMYPVFQQVPEGVIITYHLLENPVLTDVNVSGNSVMKKEEIDKLITLRKGEILNNRTLHENVTHIQDKYREDGYILSKISDLHIDPDGKLIIKINEGILEGYQVKGNKKTRTKVITREMRQKPGEVFNVKKARRSVQRVQNLGFFEDVNIKLNPGVAPNAVVMEIDVKERPTGTFGIGAGYSSSDGLLFSVSVGDKNFNGMGDAVNLSVEIGGDSSDTRGYIFSYTRPWLDKRETSGTLRLYNRTYDYYDYDGNGDKVEEYMRRYSGAEITLGRPTSEYSTNFLTLRRRKDTYTGHEGGDVDRSWSSTRPEDKEWREYNFGTTHSITLARVTDTRDNVMYPTKGDRVSISAEVAGLGGDFSFQKGVYRRDHFWPVGKSQVLAARLEGGIGHGHLSEFNQFRVGGQDSLRGYRDNQFRGDKMVLASLEYRFPLFTKVVGAVFTDWGGAWGGYHYRAQDVSKIHGSIGIGVGLNTPLGLIRLDYGRGSKGGRVHFNVGGGF